MSDDLFNSQRPITQFSVPHTGMQTSYMKSQISGGGQSLNRQIEVTSRPAVTKEGMKGVVLNSDDQSQTLAASGFGNVNRLQNNTGRIAKDRSYWIGIIRQRISAITNEIEILTKESQKIQQYSKQTVQIRNQQTLTAEEISKKKKILANLNLSVERIEDDPDIIKTEVEKLKQRNKKIRVEVDNIFLSGKETKISCSELEKRIIGENSIIRKPNFKWIQ